MLIARVDLCKEIIPRGEKKNLKIVYLDFSHPTVFGLNCQKYVNIKLHISGKYVNIEL